MTGRIAPAVLAAVMTALPCATAYAEPAPPVPQAGATCRADLVDVMTLLADGQTYAICQQRTVGYAWTEVQTPFEPGGAWLSYGPAITLHGQGMRNPNVTSGMWTATPLDDGATCRAEQQTVVEAGVLSEAQVFQGDPDKPMVLPMLPKLFYVKLSGYCLWTRN